jgi:hypothetical protein
LTTPLFGGVQGFILIILRKFPEFWNNFSDFCVYLDRRRIIWIIRKLRVKMPNNKWERVSDPNDPERCQCVNSQGQCFNKAVAGSNFCLAHGGNRGRDTLKEDELKNYRLSKFKQRTGELGSSPGITSLRDEIAVLRLLAEERLNACKDTNDLLLVSGPLSDLLIKITTVVDKCTGLELKLGNYLDRTKILNFSQTVVEIISRHIQDEEKLEQISNEILETLEEI